MDDHFEKLRRQWANTLGINEPHWLILIAVAAIDEGNGAPISEIAKLTAGQLHLREKGMEEARKQRARRQTSEQSEAIRVSLTDKSLSLMEEFMLD